MLTDDLVKNNNVIRITLFNISISTKEKIMKKVAFITDGNRGIGFETAKALGAEGVRIIIGCRDAI
jgi:hypothetical protein